MRLTRRLFASVAPLSRSPRFVPFALSSEEAAEAAREYLPWVSPLAVRSALTANAAVPTLVPFWTFDATVHSVFRGEVAVRQTHRVYNAGADRHSVKMERKWEDRPAWLDAGDHRYSPRDSRMQVYAGFTFRRQYVQALKGDFVQQSEPLQHTRPASVLPLTHNAEQGHAHANDPAPRGLLESDALLPDELGGGTAGVHSNAPSKVTVVPTPEDFASSDMHPQIPIDVASPADVALSPTLAAVEMMPDFAWRMARARIDVAEAALARDSLLQRYSAEDVRGLLVHTTVLSGERQLVYLPAYIFHVAHGGRPFRIFVSGVSGQVGGERFYSSTGLGSLAGALAGLATALVFPEPTTVLAATAVPAAIAGALGRYLPAMSQSTHERSRLREIEAQRKVMATALSEAMEQEVQLRESRFERRLESEEKDAAPSPQAAPQRQGEGDALAADYRDVDGHYTALGLASEGPRASTAEIKAAFRTRAWEEDLLWPEQRNKRDDTYSCLVRAYRTLRNHKSRAAYDKRCMEAARPRD